MTEEKSASDDSGFILVDKPEGITSHDVIARLRRITGIKKIGHAGTLDPAAAGLLLCAIGRPATRCLNEFVKLDKEYEAKIILGKVSATYDREGKISQAYAGKPLSRREVAAALISFLGKQDQVPPMFSAKKINGKKLYQLARSGVEIERRPATIEIYELKILKYRWPELSARVKCSSGTYIRTLADDLGKKLGCGAYLAGLTRTAIGKFNLKKARKLAKINQANWRKLIFRKKCYN
ncbi:MAG TPA: tRNA pseudouridine(55) synthase TruB [Candidatus Methylomirabilis sp.]|nr:tRNA pseudouridine(55) synthase TruB [Candidatus Methylomirabilis sp.]